MGEGDAAGRPADLVEPPGDLRPVGDDAFVRAGGASDPAVGAAADALEHRRCDDLRVGRQVGLDLRPAGDPETRPRRQWRVDRHVREIVVAAVMRDLVAGPELCEDVEDLVGAPAALAELDPGDAEFVRVPADPYPELVAA